MKMEPNCYVEVASRKEMINYHNELASTCESLANTIDVKSKATGVALLCLWGLWWMTWKRTNRLEKEIERLKEEREEE